MTQPLWQAEAVIRAVRGHSLHEQSWQANGVSIDSRSLQPGDLFVALQGPTNDAHNFVADAFRNGASAAIVQRTIHNLPPDAPQITVEDSFTALQDLGGVGRLRSQAKIIGLTGSVGKTGCKEQLRLMLGSLAPTYATEKSYNNHWGVPLSLARLPVSARYGVFEMGMNHAGEIATLTRQVKPHVSLITTIAPVHLEFFKSIEGIADAKAEIFLGMQPDGIAVLNRDNAHFARLTAAARTQGLRSILSFGRDAKAEGRLLAIAPMDDGSRVSVEIMGQKLTYMIGTPGEHIAFNSVGCLLTAAAAGADVVAAAESLISYRPPQGRGTQQILALNAHEQFTLIDESYNASPIAVQAALKVLAGLTPTGQGRRIAILGDMRELGPSSPSFHADLARDAADCQIDVVHCCGPLMKYLHDALPGSRRGLYAPSSRELAPLLAATLRAGDIVMVKGSLGSHMKLVVEALQGLPNQAQAQMLAG
jgi:UDP-N-acetylmuramoyl-tripeptide--D-alanyl-D-alanine ligase